ncbi:MAG: methyltransferase domain-containing protein [Nanoarchaeota archaeon]|nr:methyltransferase domain-containing protein [Nanoarchaeota archaeon]
MKLTIILNFKNSNNFIIKLKPHIKKITDNYEILQSNNLKDALTKAKGDFILTLDKSTPKDLSFIQKLWENKSDITVLSRINKLSKNYIINKISSKILQLPIKDVHSNIRIYKNIFKNINLDNKSNLQLQTLVKACFEGYKIKEIKIKDKKYNLKLNNYFKSLKILRRIRNSVNSADYDYRAYYSKFPLQGSWHRKRYNIIMNFLDNKKNILDLGCGGSKIIQDLKYAIGLDLAMNKLRFIKQKKQLLIRGDATNLPFKSSSFKTIICSEIIEHIKDGNKLLDEICRVLKKDGILILGTPDYNKITWNILEKTHNLFFKDLGHVHIRKYTFNSLNKLLKEKGFKIIGYKYIFNSELIIKAKK